MYEPHETQCSTSSMPATLSQEYLSFHDLSNEFDPSFDDECWSEGHKETGKTNREYKEEENEQEQNELYDSLYSTEDRLNAPESFDSSSLTNSSAFISEPSFSGSSFPSVNTGSTSLSSLSPVLNRARSNYYKRRYPSSSQVMNGMKTRRSKYLQKQSINEDEENSKEIPITSERKANETSRKQPLVSCLKSLTKLQREGKEALPTLTEERSLESQDPAVTNTNKISEETSERKRGFPIKRERPLSPLSCLNSSGRVKKQMSSRPDSKSTSVLPCSVEHRESSGSTSGHNEDEENSTSSHQSLTYTPSKSSSRNKNENNVDKHKYDDDIGKITSHKNNCNINSKSEGSKDKISVSGRRARCHRFALRRQVKHDDVNPLPGIIVKFPVPLSERNIASRKKKKDCRIQHVDKRNDLCRPGLTNPDERTSESRDDMSHPSTVDETDIVLLDNDDETDATDFKSVKKIDSASAENNNNDNNWLFSAFEFNHTSAIMDIGKNFGGLLSPYSSATGTKTPSQGQPRNFTFNEDDDVMLIEEVEVELVKGLGFSASNGDMHLADDLDGAGNENDHHRIEKDRGEMTKARRENGKDTWQPRRNKTSMQVESKENAIKLPKQPILKQRRSDGTVDDHDMIQSIDSFGSQSSATSKVSWAPIISTIHNISSEDEHDYDDKMDFSSNQTLKKNGDGDNTRDKNIFWPGKSHLENWEREINNAVDKGNTPEKERNSQNGDGISVADTDSTFSDDNMTKTSPGMRKFMNFVNRMVGMNKSRQESEDITG